MKTNGEYAFKLVSSGRSIPELATELHPRVAPEWHRAAPARRRVFLLQNPSGSAIPGVGSRWHLRGTRRHRVGSE